MCRVEDRSRPFGIFLTGGAIAVTRELAAGRRRPSRSKEGSPAPATSACGGQLLPGDAQQSAVDRLGSAHAASGRLYTRPSRCRHSAGSMRRATRRRFTPTAPAVGNSTPAAISDLVLFDEDLDVWVAVYTGCSPGWRAGSSELILQTRRRARAYVRGLLAPLPARTGGLWQRGDTDTLDRPGLALRHATDRPSHPIRPASATTTTHGSAATALAAVSAHGCRCGTRSSPTQSRS
jgi:hypothetical protein